MQDVGLSEGFSSSELRATPGCVKPALLRGPVWLRNEFGVILPSSHELLAFVLGANQGLAASDSQLGVQSSGAFLEEKPRADKPSVVRGEHPWEATESKAQVFIDHHHQDAPRIVLSRKPFKLVRSHPLLNGGSHCTSGTHFTDNPGRCGLNSDRRERRSAICKHFSCHFVSFFLNLTDLESGDINEKCRVGLSITACTNIATALPNILLPLGSWLVKQE
ncbi:PREDICTED: uncharacterized protein LOC105578233 [Cercocebus atys]|uniref:uncharacterized protein LOC105578233 n=1 Tax=Cercocebus atys TaxID=9531 RepID=UPI0005F3966B|nr:PREDICTED: uncharacterized protein LOC105578233 [Cercocebus atys]